jgi:hypothetical protein
MNKSATPRRQRLLAWAQERRRVRAVLYGLSAAASIGVIVWVLVAPTQISLPGASATLFAAGLSWLIVTLIRGAEGRFTLEFGRVVHAGARATTLLWLGAFGTIAISLFAFAVLGRLPNPLWTAAQLTPAPTSASAVPSSAAPRPLSQSGSSGPAGARPPLSQGTAPGPHP